MDIPAEIKIIKNPITKAELIEIAKKWFGDLAKATVDIEKGIIALGGDLHADEEQLLLKNGSNQKDLWGINIYPGVEDESWIEFDSMINIRPSQGNRSRSIEDKTIQDKIRAIVKELIV